MMGFATRVLAAACLIGAVAVERAVAQVTPAQTPTPPATPTETPGSKTSTPKPGSGATTDPQPTAQGECKDFCVRDLFVGVGIGLTNNIGGKRTSTASAVDLPNGTTFVQIKESENTDIRVLFETHYLLKNQSVFNAKSVLDVGAWLPALAACGPFALVGAPDVQRRGCGPFVAVAMETDAKVAEFGLGWFVGFGEPPKAGEEKRKDGFGLGAGVIVNPDSETVDGLIVDTQTMLVRPQFQQAVRDKTLSLTTKEATTSFLIMVSKDF
jgi:hypothetical protein